MFTATFLQGGSILKKLTDILKGYVNEATLSISEGGISLQSMDVAHIALIDLIIYPDAIDIFECDDVYKIGIDFETFGKILKANSNGSKCCLKYDPENDPDILYIYFDNSLTSKKMTTYKMRLLECTSELLEVPENIEHNCQQSMDATELNNLFKDLSTFSEHVTVTKKGRLLTLDSKGTSANIQTEIETKEDSICEVTGTYSLKYLTWFTRANILKKDVTFAFDEQKPLLMQYENDEIRVKFFLSAMSM